jgi:hypothetical protein
VQGARYGSPLQSPQWRQEEELQAVCETRSAAAAAAAGLRINSASPNRANTSWHSTTTFTAQQQQQQQQWRPSSAGADAAAAAGAAAGRHARSCWGSMPGYASSSHCSLEGAADAAATRQQPCTREVPLRPLASPSHFDSDRGVADSLGARADIRNATGSGAAHSVAAGAVAPAERYAALVAGADAALKQLAECRRAAAAHDAGSSSVASRSGRSGPGAGYVISGPASKQKGATERAYCESWLPAQQFNSSSTFHSKHSQAVAGRLTPATGAGVSAAADSSSSSRWHASHDVRATGNLTAGAGMLARAGVGASGDNGGSSARWHELRAELQAMDGDLDAAEAALRAASARLGSRQ